MKKFGIFLPAAAALIPFFGCLSTDSVPETEPTYVVVSQTEPEQETHPAEQTEDDEYIRSVSALAQEEQVSKDTFEDDKKTILKTIQDLETIMKNGDYQAWLSLVSPASIAYWKNPLNLKEVSSRLPVKGFQIKSMEDYFKFIFIPSRQGRVVDEIRYISGTSVKAVQVQDNTDIIYYYFEKIDDEWFLSLDRL
ncbi:hypothetical protein [Treponema brennaborense]|uniref:Lipoprotein n=1 Tax=Treponema brennaborense (strain DSM 12168 / CIP 105900 / DD5/3) TaxID=906968 RepID=F4LN76_TREBD|nr:hypothetical protein [Treponema brennaborense]AEE16841.1 putative lipoprotein [Treponema brennaborense DSM 12168]